MIEKGNLVNSWRLSPTDSPSIVTRSLEKFDAKIKGTIHTFAMIKLIEACLESLPQLILLLGFLTVSLIDNQSISTENVDTSSEAIFFVLNISFSFFTVVISIIASVDIRKETQLSLKQKCSLGLSYILQILSRVIPMFLIVLLTIQNKIRMAHALVLLILPLPVHWFLHYLTFYFTAQSFMKMELFDQVLHILINTFIVIPLRTPIIQKIQVHKSKQLFWSFLLFMMELFALLLIISFLLPAPIPSYYLNIHTILYSFGYFLYILFVCFLKCIIDDSFNAGICCGIFIIFIVGLLSVIIFVTFNNLGYQHLLVLIAGILFPLGPLTLYHFYHSVHMWSKVDKERIESQWPPIRCNHCSIQCTYGIKDEDQGGTEVEDIALEYYKEHHQDTENKTANNGSREN